MDDKELIEEIKVLRAENDRLREAAKWIPVNERLPENRTDVLACFQGQFGWVFFVAQKQYDQLHAAGYADPTHWQPLPETVNFAIDKTDEWEERQDAARSKGGDHE